MEVPSGALIAPVIWLLAACGPRPHAAPSLTERDRSAIHDIDTTFVQAWLRDDTATVLRLFHPRAVLFPPNAAPVEGVDAIKAYWWPADGSHTRITAFDRVVREVDGSGGFAYLRGAATLSWAYRKDGAESAQTSRSTDLVLLARDSAGAWRIIRQMWTQLPP